MTDKYKQQKTFKSYEYRKGWYIDKYGYKHIKKPDHPFCDSHRYIYEHRLVMEQHIGRYLTRKESIHHKNCNKLDNRIQNLMLFSSHSKHLSYEMIGNKRTKKDMTDRICFLCNSRETYTDKKGHEQWSKYQNGFICKKCYDKERKNKKK